MRYGFRGCPATGRVFHQFDKDTHQCACGRWERGFKPKTEPKCKRDECQICERQQALTKDGRLVNHGYQRPGWGYIVGNCPGVAHLPYPDTKALKSYLLGLREYVATQNRKRDETESAKALYYTFEKTDYSKTGGRTKTSVERVIKVGDQYRADPEFGPTYSLPAFDDLQKRRLAAIDNDIKHAEREIARVDQRIAKAAFLVEAK